MNINEINGAITAILFISGGAVPLSAIALALNLSEAKAKGYIESLADDLRARGSGVLILEINGSYQMCTNPDYFPYITNANKHPPRKALTQTQLETLAIIAYKQPVSRADIERIRGVDATHTVNKLIEYELVCETGRANAPGRALLFGTTDKFLAHFGFSRLEQLTEL